MNTGQIKKSIIYGSFWSIGGQLISIAIILFVNICLARLLNPKEFGQYGIIMFFVTVCNVLIEGGMGGALVRKNIINNDDYSTVFIFNIIFSLICFSLIMLFSPTIVEYFNIPNLVIPLKVISTLLIINAFQIVPVARLMANMRYKQKSIYQFIAIIISSIIGIFLAKSGFGIWSLITMVISKTIFETILIWGCEKTYFKIVFSRTSFKKLFNFGINTSIASLINIIFDNIYQLILGKYFSINQVGYYYQAKRLQEVPNNLFISASQGVIFSGLSKMQENQKQFNYFYYKIFSFLSTLFGLITIILFVYSKEIVIILFGMKWENSGIYLKILCIASFYYIQENSNRVIFKVYDKTNILLYLEIIKKIFQIIFIYVGIKKSDIMILLIGILLSNIIGYLINSYFSSRIIRAKIFKEIKISLKLCIVMIITCITSILLKKWINLNGMSSFLLLVYILPFYFIMIKIFKIISIKEQYLNILNTFSN